MSVVVKKLRSGKGQIDAGTSARQVESSEGMWERISRKAYELWEERGRQEGDALKDWFDAEEIVMDEIHAARH